MFIDFYILIESTLLIAFRKIKLLNLIRVLTANQLQKLFSEYLLFRSQMLQKANTTAQVCSLEIAAKKLLDAEIVIEELDGKPYDFIVNTYSDVDIQKLTSLLNTYKPAGKSYVFSLSNVIFSCQYINYVNEDIVELYSCTYTEFVNEDNGVITISLYVTRTSSNVVHINAFASDNLPVEVVILGTLVSNDYGYLQDLNEFSITIPAGINDGVATVGTFGNNSLYISQATVTPSSSGNKTFILNYNNGINGL